MNKSESLPNLLNQEKTNKFKKSKSTEDLAENTFIFEEFFEGDGPLGIRFIENSDRRTEILSIDEGTVASEVYGLTINMVLMKIGNKDISKNSHEEVMSKLSKKWRKQRCIHLTFKKKINKNIYTILSGVDLVDYYDRFIDLGAKELIDFEFVEEGDLIQFGMTKGEIIRFNTIIN